MESSSLNCSIDALKTSRLKENPVSLYILDVERKIVYFFLFSLMIPLSIPLGPTWSRIYFWDFSLIIIYFCWITRLILEKKSFLRLYTLDVLLITFLLWLFLCNLYGLRVDRSLEAWLLWGRGFLIYFYFSRNIKRVIKPKPFLTVIMLLILIESVLCTIQMVTRSNIGQLTQYFGSYNPAKVPTFWFKGEKYIRSPGTFFNTGIVAAWMILLLPMIFAWNLKNKKNRLLNIYSIVWVIGFLGAITTLTRTKIINIVIGALLLLFWDPFMFLSGKIKKRPLYIIIIIICFLFSAGIFLAQSGYLKIISHRAYDFSGRFEKKIAYMVSAYQIIQLNPLVGTGQGNFGLLIEKTDFQYFHHGEGVVHNIPLLIGAESGIIGLTLFLLILTYLIIKWFQIKWDGLTEPFQIISAGALTGIICMIIEIQFSATLIHHSLLPIFFVSLGTAFQRYELHDG